MKIGVVLSTYGEPSRNSFAEQWTYSYRILQRLTQKVAKIPAPVLPIIATSRAVGRVKSWRENDFVSDLEPLHAKTVAALAKELDQRLGTPENRHAHRPHANRPTRQGAPR